MPLTTPRASRLAAQRRGLLVGFVSLLFLAAFPAAAAAAAPPRNDEISSAVDIRSVPFTDRRDTANATYNPRTDAAGCTLGSSIWYRLELPRTQTVRLNTVGSNFDTVLGVYTGRPAALTNVDCNDDAVGLLSAVELEVRARTAYFVSVSACCSPTARGGVAVLNVYRGPLGGSISVADGQAGQISGRASLTGSHRCSDPAVTFVGVTLSQRVGRWVARGSFFAGFVCGRAASDWVVQVDSETGVAFRPGRAVATVSSTQCDGIECAANPTRERVVTLVSGPRSPAAAPAAPVRVAPGAGK